MSTQVNHYVVVGVMLPYEKGGEQYEKYEQFMDSAYGPKRDGVTCIFDGMCGKYVILGHVLAKSKSDEMGFEDMLVVDDLDKKIAAVAKDLADKLGMLDALPKLIVLSHYR